VKQFVKKGVRVGTEGAVIEVESNRDLEDHLLILKRSCNELDREIRNTEVQTTRLRE
jgi:hypothetical protein